MNDKKNPTIEMPDDLVPNLDDHSTDPAEMFKLQDEFKAIAKTFLALASYSEAKGSAMQMRLKGDIASAKRFEDCLDLIYAQLPEWAAW